jgi:hypothetical protein
MTVRYVNRHLKRWMRRKNRLILIPTEVTNGGRPRSMGARMRYRKVFLIIVCGTRLVVVRAKANGNNSSG